MDEQSSTLYITLSLGQLLYIFVIHFFFFFDNRRCPDQLTRTSTNPTGALKLTTEYIIFKILDFWLPKTSQISSIDSQNAAK